MTRIFISHSHSDVEIADLLVDFLHEALELGKKDIRCTSDPNHGLAFSSASISDQLKADLTESGALIVLATLDSLRSPWILFEVGSFWTTDKLVAPLIGPGLSYEDLPGPLKGYRCIHLEKEDIEHDLNELINQLTEKLSVKPLGLTRRRQQKLDSFIRQFRAWQSKRPNLEVNPQQIKELTQKLQELKKIANVKEQEKQALERSLNDEIEQLKQQLEEARRDIDLTAQPLRKRSFSAIIQKDPLIKLEMVIIPGGSFLMGSIDGEDNEKPQHKVTIQSFSMGKYSVTQEQWRAIATRTDLKINQDLDPNPARFKDKPDSDRRPVERVSWDCAIEFCGRLSKLTGQDYRLPSEAEWEYACRAGTTTPYYLGEELDETSANHGRLIGETGETTIVGKYPANNFGLYDMHGNVWDWCADYWHENYNNASTDGRVWMIESIENNAIRVLRGGSWRTYPLICRSATRDNGHTGLRCDNVGFRVACSASRTL